MTITQEDIAAFSRFAAEQIKNGGCEYSLEQLVWLWQDANGGDVHTAIREGLADVEAGRTTPFREATDAFRRQNGLPPRDA